MDKLQACDWSGWDRNTVCDWIGCDAFADAYWNVQGLPPVPEDWIAETGAHKVCDWMGCDAFDAEVWTV